MEQIKEKQKTSFKCAYDRIPKGDVRNFLDRMKEILNVRADASVYVYIRGEREPKYTEGVAIERLFNEYGVEMNWNCSEPEKQDLQ
jgi:hypothetical protein